MEIHPRQVPFFKQEQQFICLPLEHKTIHHNSSPNHSNINLLFPPVWESIPSLQLTLSH